MPGLPSHKKYSNAGAPIFNRHIDPASTPSRVAFELKRMPLHHLTPANRYHGAITAFPVDQENSLVFAPPTIDIVNEQLPTTWHGSAESEHDLAAMVLEFMEKGSVGPDFPESSDGEIGLPSCSRLYDTLQALKFNASPYEKELLSILSMFFLSSKDKDLFCIKSSAECNVACIRRVLVKHLRQMGYEAVICSTKWSNSGKVPGGEYEYIDVLFKNQKGLSERVIVDVDFQSQFEIARPTHSYMTALQVLPVIFVGSEEKLRQVLKVMAEAAKMSLKQNSMPLPPWRTLDYMNAKWCSPFERLVCEFEDKPCRFNGNSDWRCCTRTKQCLEQLRHLKLAMVAEMDKSHLSKPMNLERNRAMHFAKTRKG